MKTHITESDFTVSTSALTGLSVSRAWKGYGSTIFIELGILRYSPKHPKGDGEVCITIDWDWRLEDDLSIICGSSNSGPEITDCLAKLNGQTIVSAILHGSPRELVVTLSSGLRLRSMAMLAGNPQWAIRLSNGSWLSSDGSSLISTDGSYAEGLTKKEQLVSELAEAAASRWSGRGTEVRDRHCRDCRYYVRLDGNFHFLDYGVCSAAQSEFDGKVMNLSSGCPEHAKWE